MKKRSSNKVGKKLEGQRIEKYDRRSDRRNSRASADESQRQRPQSTEEKDGITTTPADRNSEWASVVEGYVETSLSRAKIQWVKGEWDVLAGLDLKTFERHPERDRFALLLGGANLQLGNHIMAREYIHMALKWGCPPRLVAQILVAVVHNTLGRMALVNRDEVRAMEHFRSALTGLTGDVRLAGQVRAARESFQLGLQMDPSQVSENSVPSGTSLVVPLADDPATALKDAMRTVNEQFEALKGHVQTSLDAGKSNPYVHNRTMTPSLNKSLRDFFAEKFGKENLKATYIDYLALRAMQIEKNCIGRLATTIQDAVVRQLVAESVPGERLGILEIGALFGISLAILYNHGSARFDSVQVICLDPFDGYYGQALDVVLNTPVTHHVFLRNMQLSSIPKEDFHLIQHYSTDPAAIKLVRDHSFNLLIIDGDHAYAGVKFDFDNYFPLLEPGGYVIFDDYNSKEWPDVKAFVDGEVMKDPRCEFMGAVSRTAICRKKLNTGDQVSILK